MISPKEEGGTIWEKDSHTDADNNDDECDEGGGGGVHSRPASGANRCGRMVGHYRPQSPNIGHYLKISTETNAVKFSTVIKTFWGQNGKVQCR